MRASLTSPQAKKPQDVVSVTGRLIFMRNTGKLCFATLQDGDGTQLQAMLSLAEWKADVDLGDFIGVTGRVIASLRGNPNSDGELFR